MSSALRKVALSYRNQFSFGTIVTGKGLPRCHLSSLSHATWQSHSNHGDGHKPNGQTTSAETGDGEHTTTEGEPTVEEIQRMVLNTALEFVSIHGWTVKSLTEAAKHEGYPGVTHGMFPRGGGDLMHHFVKECNSELAEKLAKEAADEMEEGQRKRTGAFIRDALETRLRMITPYVDQWPEAMALTARPENIAEHFTNLANLMDTIWYHAGDRSADFNWYTKRLSLAAVYKSTELCLIQDKSPDFEDTWVFLDNRLADFTRFAKARSEMDTARAALGDFMSAAFTTRQRTLQD